MTPDFKAITMFNQYKVGLIQYNTQTNTQTDALKHNLLW